jgi:hypothetical protein
LIAPTILLSRYFTLADLCRSETALADGIDNSPPPELLGNLRRLAQGLDQIQDLLRAPLAISSGFRCALLNARVGGVPDSQHSRGCAADFDCPAFGAPIEFAAAVVRSSIAFDQIILEYGRWVHVSFTETPRRRALTIYGSEPGYCEGVLDRDGTRVA